jgi:DNA-binding response OmpR family regulator
MPTQLNIMVVEDHHMLREATVTAIREAGHQVDGVMSAEDIPKSGANSVADIYVVDLNLPGEDGLSLSVRLKAMQPNCGIIMMTARTLTADRVQGYASGADIYLPKPVALSELLAAIESLGRRVVKDRADAAISAGAEKQIQLDPDSRVINGPAGQESLSEREVALLLALIRSRSRRLETWQLIEAMGEDPLTYQKSALEVVMTRIRHKLAKAGASDRGLVSLRGFGYQLAAKVEIR